MGREQLHNVRRLYTRASLAVIVKWEPGHRERLYQDYARNFRDPKIVFDFRASALLGKAYDYYFRGWLPQRSAEPGAGCRLW